MAYPKTFTQYPSNNHSNSTMALEHTVGLENSTDSNSLIYKIAHMTNTPNFNGGTP